MTGGLDGAKPHQSLPTMAPVAPTASSGGSGAAAARAAAARAEAARAAAARAEAARVVVVPAPVVTAPMEAAPAEVAPVGGTAAFEAFVHAALPNVLRLAARSGAVGADGEDVAAEAFARAYVAWRTVGTLPHREAWVLRTASNLLCDRARRAVAARAPQVTLPVPGFEQEVVDRAVLVSALRRLSKRQREAVLLHYWAGRPLAEVAQAMGAAPNSVKKHLARGLAALRADLAAPESRLKQEVHDEQ